MAASLLDHDIDLVAILHLEAVRSVVVLDSLAVEDEAALVVGEALSLAVGVHELLELRGSLDFEVDLGAILSLDFDVDVLLFLSVSGGSGSVRLVGFSVCHLCKRV